MAEMRSLLKAYFGKPEDGQSIRSVEAVITLPHLTPQANMRSIYQPELYRYALLTALGKSGKFGLTPCIDIISFMPLIRMNIGRSSFVHGHYLTSSFPHLDGGCVEESL